MLFRSGDGVPVEAQSQELSQMKSDDEVPDTTVANWIMETLGRLPRAGETLVWRNLTILVSRVKRQRVLEIHVTETAK